MKTGIVFDMDGTLWDSAKEVAASWNKVVVSKGLPALTAEDLERVMGLPMNLLARKLFPQLLAQESFDLMEECVVEENEYLRQHGATLYPGLLITLKQLKEVYPLYIVSNCQSGYIEAFLEHYGLEDVFEDIQCYGYNQKPKGDNIRILAQRNGLDRTVYVGDIQGDYEATMQAGGIFVHAAYGFGTLSDDIRKKVPAIHAFCELPAVLDELLQSD
ncbi:MAG: HAD family hydrolase [bacterium]|nr:HAD family hydrolase [bacterium]